MKKHRIFVLEFVAGGGFNQVEIPGSLFTEGYGMLRSIIADFKDLGFEIETFLDFRITLLSRYLKADFINVIQKDDNFFQKFKECVRKNKFCFIIAPEFSNVLYKLTKVALKNNNKVLSVDLEGIKLGSSKLKTYYFFQENEINTPTTFLIPNKQANFDINFIINKFRQFNAPIIIKPEDGVGAEDIYYFNAEEQIFEFFSKNSHLLDQSRNYILQKYIEGKDLSVSLIGHRDPPMIISVNTQNVEIKDLSKESQYFGGYTPVENWVELKMSLKKYIEKFKQFTGYFGLDFIQQKNGELSFIEINPRLTTSYIGIRNIVKENIMEVLLNLRDSTFDLDEIEIQYFSKFGHLSLKYIGKAPFEEINKKIIPQILKLVPEIVTPPIKLKTIQEDCFSCFIATKSKDIFSSKIRIKKILQILKEKGFIIKSSKLI